MSTMNYTSRAKQIIAGVAMMAALTASAITPALAHTTFNGKVRIVCLGDNEVSTKHSLFSRHTTRVNHRYSQSITTTIKKTSAGNQPQYEHSTIDKSYVKAHTSTC